MAIISRSGLDALVSLAMMAFSALVVFASGIAILALLPGTLLTVAIALSEQGSRAELSNPGWMYIVWFPAALFVAYYNALTGLEAVNDPTARRTAKLVVSSALILATCPLLW